MPTKMQSLSDIYVQALYYHRIYRMTSSTGKVLCKNGELSTSKQNKHTCNQIMEVFKDKIYQMRL